MEGRQEFTQKYQHRTEIDHAIYAQDVAAKLAKVGVGQYAGELRRVYNPTHLSSAMRQLGDMVQPIDRTLGVDPTHLGRDRFIIGSSVAINIARQCLGAYYEPVLLNKIISMINQLQIKGDTDDMVGIFTYGAQMIMEVGAEGYALTDDAYEGIVTDISAVYCQNVQYESYLKSGFGFIMKATTEVLHDRKQRLQEQKLGKLTIENIMMDEFDWNGELRKLTD